MRRALSIYLPTFATDIARRRLTRAGTPGSDAAHDARLHADAAILLIGTQRGQRLVSACCTRAMREGVTVGMTLAHARSLLPTRVRVIEQDATPGRDRAALGQLALWALRFTPVVSTDPPDGMLLDIGGCARVFKGEQRLVNMVKRSLHQLGFAACIAVAPTIGCAWGLARYGSTDQAIVPGGARSGDGTPGVIAALSPLPVEALRVDAGACDGLREVNITTVGQLLAVPRDQILSRFGEALLLRLDQALGEAWEHLEPIRPVPPIVVQRVFDGPSTQTEAIAITARELLGELLARCDQRQQGVRRLTLELSRVDTTPERMGVTLSRASRNAAHLWSLLAPRLEQANLGYGVDEVTLAAPRTGMIRHEQARRWGDSGAGDSPEAARAVSELIDTLSNRLGPGRVARVAPVESHVPERASERFPAGMDRADTAPARDTARSDRPSILLDPPERVRVIAVSPDGPIAVVNWRDVDHVVATTVGPERLSPEWWRTRQSGATPATRDYFKVQDSGGVWLWLYRELSNPNWFVHGVWA